MRNSKRHVHPFRHLLFMHFIKQNIETLQDIPDYTNAFGEGPFPCLNKAASHYKEYVIPGVKLQKILNLKISSVHLHVHVDLFMRGNRRLIDLKLVE